MSPHPVQLERSDRFAAAGAVADATLYEGYVLYPYRASALKNRMRWQFGVLAPPGWARADGSERSACRTECLVHAGDDALLSVRVRFLQLQRRTVEARGADGYRAVDELRVGPARWVPWDEAVERVVDLPPIGLEPRWAAHEVPFALEPGTAEEPLHEGTAVVGRLVRTWSPVEGHVSVVVAPAGDRDAGVLRVSVSVANATSWIPAPADRDDALARSLVGVHTLLAVDHGRFASAIDPPPELADAAAGCASEGTFPVLVADPSGGPDVVLSSPITLHDHPHVAPESAGDMYDATEIDEILALRVLTLTEDEKAEARGTDPRAAAVVDRCDAMAPEVWQRLHGTMRDVDDLVPTVRTPTDPGSGPVEAGQDEASWWDPEVDAGVDPWSDSVTVAGVEVASGTKVVLRPNRRSDAQDLFLRDMAATVVGVFRDVDGTTQVAVTVDDDPATEVLAWQGRHLFFFPDEIEPVP